MDHWTGHHGRHQVVQFNPSKEKDCFRGNDINAKEDVQDEDSQEKMEMNIRSKKSFPGG